MQAVVAQAAGAVGLVVINHEPGGVTFAMPGVSDLGEDTEGGGVSIPVAMVRGTGVKGLVDCLFGKGQDFLLAYLVVTAPLGLLSAGWMLQLLLYSSIFADRFVVLVKRGVVSFAARCWSGTPPACLLPRRPLAVKRLPGGVESLTLAIGVFFRWERKTARRYCV